MALWGNNDSLATKGTDGAVGLITAFNYASSGHGYGAKTLFGSNTQFGETGHAGEGDVLRIGKRGAGGTYYGDVVVVSVATTERVTVASTASLVNTGINNLNTMGGGSTTFTASQMPKYATLDLQGDRYRNQGSDFNTDCLVYGIGTAANALTTGETQYHTAHEGWVGVQTYIDSSGALRVKKEVLVAMSGIATAGIGSGIPYPTQA